MDVCQAFSFFFFFFFLRGDRESQMALFVTLSLVPKSASEQPMDLCRFDEEIRNEKYSARCPTRLLHPDNLVAYGHRKTSRGQQASDQRTVNVQALEWQKSAYKARWPASRRRPFFCVVTTLSGRRRPLFELLTPIKPPSAVLESTAGQKISDASIAMLLFQFVACLPVSQSWLALKATKQFWATPQDCLRYSIGDSTEKAFLFCSLLHGHFGHATDACVLLGEGLQARAAVFTSSPGSPQLWQFVGESATPAISRPDVLGPSALTDVALMISPSNMWVNRRSYPSSTYSVACALRGRTPRRLRLWKPFLPVAAPKPGYIVRSVEDILAAKPEPVAGGLALDHSPVTGGALCFDDQRLSALENALHNQAVDALMRIAAANSFRPAVTHPSRNVASRLRVNRRMGQALRDWLRSLPLLGPMDSTQAQRPHDTRQPPELAPLLQAHQDTYIKVDVLPLSDDLEHLLQRVLRDSFRLEEAVGRGAAAELAVGVIVKPVLAGTAGGAQVWIAGSCWARGGG